MTLKSAKYWWLRAKVIVDVPPKKISLVVDDKNYNKVYVNGKEIEVAEQANIYDRGNRGYKLDGYLKRGENTIVVGVGFPEWWSERVAPRQAIDPIVITGHFEVQHQNGLQKLVKCETKKKIGSWHEQGYPYYSGIGIYEQTFTLPELNGRVFLEMKGIRETVEVFVNGQLAGTRIWSPFKVEIGDLIKKGKNTITLKIANTLENLFEKPYPSGLTEMCQISVY